MIRINKKKWISNNINLIPDFIISGAMKSATTTIHEVLSYHPDIFIPRSEIRFFELDNILQHPRFHSFDKNTKSWTGRLDGKKLEESWNWYHNLYKGNESKIKGEDSTSYLASRTAAQRIASQNKNIKMIFLLRQPSLRAFSQYLHMLRSGTAMWSFEDTLVHNPYSVLTRSLYKEQLQHYYDVLPSNQIKVILFEDLVSDPERVLINLSTFLKIDFNLFPKDIFNTHANRAKLPKFPELQMQGNKIIENLGPRYINDLQNRKYQPISHKVFEKIYDNFNPSIAKAAPKINRSTKDYLDSYFYKELFEIEELVGQKILTKWFN
ncbi:hypothetical protein APR41_08025 [Salegentibacter salinarum]|uniref:Sulfotransferase domain-containing protein n=1 Tax=Salegentibacter salinarum TaxID=447422 RepID=A0A2N0TPU8_9FLAO|nr:sulfotransferase [Salegentibacter salinarum]PKD16744.1 hypothetical protein APR41_08025 [Salegentibacter salinarum]SKB59754.1 Sulfotransferase domain-containing protein [Salegentibacter salinarum]